MLVISQKKGQKFRIGRDITVTVIEAKQGKVKLGIEAPDSIPVQRLSHEILDHQLCDVKKNKIDLDKE